MRSITSIHNPLLKDVRKAASDATATHSGLLIAEGPHLLEEAARSTWTVEHVLFSAAAKDRLRWLLDAFEDCAIEIPEPVFTRLAPTATSQGVISLLRPRAWTPAELYPGNCLVVILDGVQDPGNAGTITRSAEAFGATGVVFHRRSVRVANPKFLRASSGSIFRLPFIESSDDGLQVPGDENVRMYALHPSADLTLGDADFRAPCALVVGSEGGGISPQWLQAAIPIRIPAEKVESLNAAVACSIALFAAAGQRAGK